MSNPFLDIPLEIYEKHMSLNSIYQLQTLNEIMKDQLNHYEISSSMILGIAGGNGLEHVNTNKIDVVYGVDINSKYLQTCRERYSYLGSHFIDICANMIDLSVCLPKADLVIANLFVEYIGYETFACHMKKINPKYISVIIQVNIDCDDFVSESPYIHAFHRVSEVHHQMEESKLKLILGCLGYTCILKKEYSLPNKKQFQRLDFKWVLLN